MTIDDDSPGDTLEPPAPPSPDRELRARHGRLLPGGRRRRGRGDPAGRGAGRHGQRLGFAPAAGCRLGGAVHRRRTAADQRARGRRRRFRHRGVRGRYRDLDRRHRVRSAVRPRRRPGQVGRPDRARDARRCRRPARRPVGGGGRQSAWPRRFGDGRGDQRTRSIAADPLRPGGPGDRGRHPDRRRPQPGQLRRRTGRRDRPGGGDQHRGRRGGSRSRGADQLDHPADHRRVVARRQGPPGVPGAGQHARPAAGRVGGENGPPQWCSGDRGGDRIAGPSRRADRRATCC